MRTLVHVGLMVLLVSVVGRFGAYEMCHLNGRFRGVFGNPNEFSHWWMSLFVLGLLPRGTSTIAELALIALTAVLFFWSGTRGAILACLLSLVGWWIQSTASSMVRPTTKALVVVAGLFLASMALSETIVAVA